MLLYDQVKGEQLLKIKGGNKMYKYCVAHLYVNCLGESRVSYYAYQKGPYGLHLTEDYNDENILWYETEKEAKGHILNSCECIVSRWFNVEVK